MESFITCKLYTIGHDGRVDGRFNQFDSSRTGQLNSFDLQRLLAKDETIEAREDCVKMVSLFRECERDMLTV